MYVFSLFAASKYGSRLISSSIPRYPSSRIVYIDCVTFCLACLKLLLKAPLLTAKIRNLAFSSYFKPLSDIFSAKTSIKSVSSCVLVKLLFFESIFTNGSFNE